MTIHKEGTATISLIAIFVGVLNILNFSYLFPISTIAAWAVFIITVAFFLFIVSFFRMPVRALTISEEAIVSPADGKVVVIEEVQPDEFYKERRIQLSVFMSPANVHVNRLPIAGNIVYNKYHPGKFLVAWHPKSSTDNERWSVVIENSKGSILCKQIAGALARRICNYSTVGQSFKQCDEYGFIKFGSRVDLLLPVGAKIHAKIGDVVKGGVTVLASW
ncbi:MAG: phosphatidylserine decarboxylase family protein [Chitinophagaceae bacterium]|nr:phosphatidylserine decarboxylase family protein [Chitinophagaceae bacterium]